MYQESFIFIAEFSIALYYASQFFVEHFCCLQFGDINE